MHWSYITSEKSFSLLIQGQIIVEIYETSLLLQFFSKMIILKCLLIVFFDKTRFQQNFSRVLISTNRWQQISLKNSARLICKCYSGKQIMSYKTILSMYGTLNRDFLKNYKPGRLIEPVRLIEW